MQAKMIAYDAATGEIVGICLTPPQLMAWQAQGLAAVDGPEDIALDTHRVVDGQVAAKIPVTLTADKLSIAADGQDQAVVTVSVGGESPPAAIVLLVADIEEEVALTDGVGAASPIVAESACAIVVRVADPITYLADPVTIEAA